MAEKVKVFISWSGELSKQLGQVVGDWLEDTLQFVEPFFTPDDVEKGTKWLPEILAELEACDLGIICLTRENLNNPWILFEAGALSKKQRSRVCTLLLDVPKADVKFPLAIFQATEIAKDDLKTLVETINKRGGDFALNESRLARAFDKCWPELREKVNAIRAEPKPVDTSTHRSTDEMVKEILELTRSIARKQEAGNTTSPLKDREEFWENAVKSWELIERMRQNTGNELRKRGLEAGELERDSFVPPVPKVPSPCSSSSPSRGASSSSSSRSSSSSSSHSPQPEPSPSASYDDSGED